MMEPLLILMGGVLGAGHCVGMCGAFALALGVHGQGRTTALARQTAYGLGRVFTYTIAGLVAGFAGWRLQGQVRSLINAQALLSLLAGGLLVTQGLLATGYLRFRRPQGKHACLVPGMFGALLAATRLRSVFLGGIINGLLPCGLVYAYLALAASSGNLIRGGATMTLFGVGTIPVLALVGCGGQALGVASRRLLHHLSAWCVVGTGAISIWRGLTAYGFMGDFACPLCH